MQARMQVRMPLAAVAVLAVLTGACSEPTPADTAPQAEPVAAVTNLVPAPTLNRSIDRELVAACIDRVQLGAFAQDPELMAMWIEAGRDIDELRRTCETLGINDPAALQALADEWGELQRTLASQPGSSTSTTGPATSGTPAPRVTTPAGRPTATAPAGVTTTVAPIAPDATPPPAPPSCGSDEVLGPDGTCVPRPTDPPAIPAPAPEPPPAPPAPDPTG